MQQFWVAQIDHDYKATSGTGSVKRTIRRLVKQGGAYDEIVFNKFDSIRRFTSGMMALMKHRKHASGTVAVANGTVAVRKHVATGITIRNYEFSIEIGRSVVVKPDGKWAQICIIATNMLMQNCLIRNIDSSCRNSVDATPIMVNWINLKN